jgi:hypothetical protein
LNITYFVKFLILLTLATAAPLLGFHSQWVTGPIVNAALILGVYMLGIRGAFFIGLLPSTIALGTGLLPAPLAPMVPFIIIANFILVLIIDWFKNELFTNGIMIKNYSIAIICAAGLKYLFLWTTSSVVINLLLKQSLAGQVSLIMGYPQFFSALMGGVIAFGALKILKK